MGVCFTAPQKKSVGKRVEYLKTLNRDTVDVGEGLQDNERQVGDRVTWKQEAEEGRASSVCKFHQLTPEVAQSE